MKFSELKLYSFYIYDYDKKENLIIKDHIFQKVSQNGKPNTKWIVPAGLLADGASEHLYSKVYEVHPEISKKVVVEKKEKILNRNCEEEMI